MEKIAANSLLKTKLAAGQKLTGCAIQSPTPAFAEICGLAGFDFLFIDAEHGPLSEGDCLAMVTAAQLRGVASLIRVPAARPEVILRYMDIGAAGVIVPGVSNAREAEAAVEAVKYYPLGRRGINATRASDYGLSLPMKDYIARSNEETIVFPILETAEAVEEAAAILAVPGIDGGIIGAGDLAQSLGYPGETSHPAVRSAIDRLMAAGRQTGKPMANVVRPGQRVQDYYGQGCQIAIVFAYSLFAAAAKAFVAEALA